MTSNLPVVDVVTYLPTVVTSPILTLGTNLFAEFLPDSPDICVAILGYSGAAPMFTMGSGSIATALPCVEQIRFQVLCRNTEGASLANEQVAENIYRAVLLTTNITIGGTNYLRWEPLQRPFFLMRDEKRRVYHAFNMSIERTPN